MKNMFKAINHNLQNQNYDEALNLYYGFEREIS